MKVSVCQCLTYTYEIEIPDDDPHAGSVDDIIYYAEENDPYFQKLREQLDGNYVIELVSVVDDKSGEVLWIG